MSAWKIRDQNAIYFLTFTIVEWVDILTRKKYRDIILNSLKYCIRNKGLILYSYVIMSNHMHLIAQAKAPSKLSDIVRDFKRHTSKNIGSIINNQFERRRNWMPKVLKNVGTNNKRNNQFQLWIQDNRPIILFSPKVTLQKLNYIHMNPVYALIVKYPEDYIYSSASFYTNQRGPLEVTILDLGCSEGYIFMGE